jgi:hypothetical protein
MQLLLTTLSWQDLPVSDCLSRDRRKHPPVATVKETMERRRTPLSAGLAPRDVRSDVIDVPRA